MWRMLCSLSMLRTSYKIAIFQRSGYIVRLTRRTEQKIQPTARRITSRPYLNMVGGTCVWW